MSYRIKYLLSYPLALFIRRIYLRQPLVFVRLYHGTNQLLNFSDLQEYGFIFPLYYKSIADWHVTYPHIIVTQLHIVVLSCIVREKGKPLWNCKMAFKLMFGNGTSDLGLLWIGQSCVAKPEIVAMENMILSWESH